MAPPLRTCPTLRDESGMVLVLALSVLLVLTITATTLLSYASAGSREASRSSHAVRAAALAEAGLNDALAVLYAAPDPRDAGAVPQQTLNVDGGTVVFSGTLSASTWTLIGTGTVRNPTGAGPITRTASQRVTITTGQQGTANNAIWNYLYADSLTSCTTLSNSVTIDIPLYVRGNLCMTNSARVTGQRLQVGGTLTLSNTASVGTASTPIQEADIAGGCSASGGPLHNPCSSADRVYAQTITSTPTGLTKPPVDLAGWYQNAQPGPNHACTSGSFPGGFDNDATMNRSRGTIHLMPGTAYDCRVLDGSGATVGRITWAPGGGGSPGTLQVAGTLFFDGDLAFTNNEQGTYQGRATISASGKISFSNNARLCGVSTCDAAWDANQNLLALVAGSSTDQVGFEMANNTVFQGAVYAVDDYQESNSAVTWGPIIARQLFISNSGQNHYVPFGTLLPGMPASYQQVTVLVNEAGSFSG